MKRGRFFIFDEKADRERHLKEMERLTQEAARKQEESKAAKEKPAP